MTANEILAALRSKGIRQMDIARKFGVSHVMIHQIIQGNSKSRRIQEEFARILGKDINEIWPKNAA